MLPSNSASPPTKRHLPQLQTLAIGLTELPTPYSVLILHPLAPVCRFFFVFFVFFFALPPPLLPSLGLGEVPRLGRAKVLASASFFFSTSKNKKNKTSPFFFLSFRLSASHRLSPPSAQADSCLYIAPLQISLSSAA